MTGYQEKLEIVGNKVTYRLYERPVLYGKRSRGGNSCLSCDKVKDSFRSASGRAARVFLEKVSSTFSFIEHEYPELFSDGWRLRFWTLTYSEEMDNRKRLSRDWNRFVVRLSRYIGSVLGTEEKIIYAAVPEIQHERAKKSGAEVWHIHVLLFSPYIDVLKFAELWRHGYVFVSGVDMGSVADVAGYMVKYMRKSFETDYKFGAHRYFMSRSCKNRKCRIYEDLGIKSTGLLSDLSLLGEPSFIEYESNYLGKVTGWDIILPRSIESLNFIGGLINNA